jgi:hypothetical protein
MMSSWPTVLSWLFSLRSLVRLIVCSYELLPSYSDYTSLTVLMPQSITPLETALDDSQMAGLA